jgi:hypothetical protein
MHLTLPSVGAVRKSANEARQGAVGLELEAGSFSDTFADPNAVHIYRIDGGSTCGLS